MITKSNWGGAQAYVFMLAKHLKQGGSEVAVALGGTGAAGADTGVLAERLSEAGIRVIHLRSIIRDISLFREIDSLIEMIRVVRVEQPTVLHLNSSKAGILGSFAGRIAGVPHIVFTAHGWPYREPRSFAFRSIIWIASWCTVLFSDVVIAVSKLDEKDSPVLFSRKKIQMIHNGVATFSLLPRDEARSKLASKVSGLHTDSLWIVMNAELHPNKGIDVAIDAMKILCKKYPAAQLVVMGSGQEHDGLQEYIQAQQLTEKVFLLGFVSDSRTYLAAADIFLFPSHKEGLPLALLEAGLASLPVIASNTGGIPEVIRSGETGILVEPGDTKAVARALSDMLTDIETAKRYGIALHKHVRSSFSEEQMFSKTLTVYSS